MKPININRIMHNKKALFLAYDQGFEHGPVDLDLKNVDPEYIFDIALEGDYTGIIVQAGIAEKYYTAHYKDVPLIIKLNGKTSFYKDVPLSLQNCSVARAVKLGAAAVGYTIYLGSQEEQKMFQEFGKIVEEAHNFGIPAIAWMYPRGPSIQDDTNNNLLAYAARIGHELGADIIKIKFHGDAEAFKWVVKSAGMSKIVVAGGSKISQIEFLKEVEAVMKTGAIGMAVGRNIWQHEKPFSLTRAVKQIIFHGKSFNDVVKSLK
jgi:class I fructose-bisphosphate aldolase